MATNDKRISNTSACNVVAPSDLFWMSANVAGNATSYSVNTTILFSNSQANLTTNIATANIMVITGNATPANNADLPTGAANGALWSDGSYIYYYNGTEIKRVALSTF
jgi:hypothetical protein